MDVPRFLQFLKTFKNFSDAAVDDATPAVSRLYHTLHVTGMDLTNAKNGEDPAVLVSMYVSGAHTDLLGLPG